MNIAGIDLSNIISWVVLGLIAGIVAHLIDPGDVRGGVLGSTITGILGALIGGFLADLFFGLRISGLNLQSLLIAVAGALILVFIQRILFRDRQHIKTETKRIR